MPNGSPLHLIRSARCVCGGLMRLRPDGDWECPDCETVFNVALGTVTNEQGTRRLNPNCCHAYCGGAAK
jgi:hypothetical protein